MLMYGPGTGIVSPWILVAMPAKYSSASIAVTASIALKSRIGLPALSNSSSASLAPFCSTSCASFISSFARAAPVLLLPAREGGKRRPHRAVDVLLVAFGEVADDLAVAGIEGRERLAAGGGNELAVDEGAPRFRLVLCAVAVESWRFVHAFSLS